LLALVFNNLLSNAVKFTQPKPEAVIEVGYEAKGQENIFYVKDNGVGFDMASADKLFIPFRRLHPYVLQHHERLNGSGYPNGLTGDKILPAARILGVADVVEAMSSHRPYRPALGIDVALAEIEMNSGILYDQEVVSTCVRLFTEKSLPSNSRTYRRKIQKSSIIIPRPSSSNFVAFV
jgi:hypothetical protein